MQPSKVDNRQLLADYYASHFDEVRSFIAKRTLCDDVASDLAQDVFVRLLCLGDIITELTLPSLVYTVARNKVYDFWRHRQSVGEYEHVVSSAQPSLASQSTDPESVYSVNEIYCQLEQGMSRLSEPQRIVYRMNMFDGLQVSEISKTLGVKYKSVEHRLGDARKIVRAYVKNARKEVV